VDSEGLMLLTNDGELADLLTHPRYESEKEYRVLIKGEPDEDRLEAWRRGVMLEGKRTAPAQVARGESAPTGRWLRIVMHEGRKHQIRDIGMLLGLPVQRLIRVRLGGLRLGNLQPGEWRHLQPSEVKQLKIVPAAVAGAAPRTPPARRRAPARRGPALPPRPPAARAPGAAPSRRRPTEHPKRAR
jgi:23S rRNA pseudouridine2605 synthase